MARLRRLDLCGSFTVTLHFRVRFPTFAQMYADPPFFPVTFPEAETDATDFLEELHFTFFLLPVTFHVSVQPLYTVTFVLLSFSFAA